MNSPLQLLEVTLRWQCVQLLYQWTYSWSPALHYSLEPLPPCPPSPSMSRSTYISFQFPSCGKETLLVTTLVHLVMSCTPIMLATEMYGKCGFLYRKAISISAVPHYATGAMRHMYCEPSFLHTVISYT